MPITPYALVICGGRFCVPFACLAAERPLSCAGPDQPAKNLSMPKIKVKNPVVELDGDEMTRVMWSFIKTKLTQP